MMMGKELRKERSFLGEEKFGFAVVDDDGNAMLGGVSMF